MRVCFFGTHPKQFNGYSKVVYELAKAMSAAPFAADYKMHVFGFQNFHNHPGHRLDIPIEVDVFDANAAEDPKQAGFGITAAKAYVERVRPDVVVVFNDLMVLTSVMNELKDASNRASFKLVAYIDQVYLCQRRDFIDVVNRLADAAIAFTPKWRECIVWQGLTVPCHVLPHGINRDTYFPIPRPLPRRFYGISEGDFLVLNLNRNQPRKRWDTCLQAFAEVVARRPDAPIKLVIATELKGAWDLVEILHRELKKRGVDPAKGASRIVVPGHPQMLTDDETNVLYNLADVGINTCDGEGFGLCNFEQAAIGIPQVVPRIGGFQLFFDDDCAILVDPVTSIYVDSTRDGVGGEAQLTRSDDYADAILRYYDDAGLRAKHGSAAREKIATQYPWSSIADRFKTILDETAPAPPPPPPPPPQPLGALTPPRPSSPVDNHGIGDDDDDVDTLTVLELLDGEKRAEEVVAAAPESSEPSEPSAAAPESSSPDSVDVFGAAADDSGLTLDSAPSPAHAPAAGTDNNVMAEVIMLKKRLDELMSTLSAK
jgi:glycosyltransferase involved in cell wall biosynthesis